MRASRRLLAFVVICVLSLGIAASANSAQAQTSDARAVSYTLQLFNLDQHLLHVHIDVPPGAAEHDLQLPVWNALYQVRDFAQFVDWIRAQSADGRPIQVHELDKSRWRIADTQNGATVDYEIYVDSFGPFGAQVNPHHVFLNLAQVLMYPVDDRDHKMVVSFHAPDGWKVASALTASKPKTTIAWLTLRLRWATFRNLISTKPVGTSALSSMLIRRITICRKSSASCTKLRLRQ